MAEEYTPPHRSRPRRRRSPVSRRQAIALLVLSYPQQAYAIHHFRLPAVHTVRRQASDLPLRITNRCGEDLWPAILTQAGDGPATKGFRLAAGATRNLTVGGDWQGRVWARTNCTFDEDGNVPPSSQGQAPCSTGDCGQMECPGAVSS
jgi:beta-mannosidase